MKFVLLLGTDGSDVRSAKICRSLTRLGHDVHFVGWNRRGVAGLGTVEGVRYHLMNYQVPLGRSTLWAQAKFALYAMQQLKALAPDVVYAVNEDNVLRAAPFKRLFFQHLICDFYDSHADRFSENRWVVRWPIQLASRFCKRISDRLVVTDWLRWERLGRFQDKARIVQNVPEDPGSDLAFRIPTGPAKLLFSGAMGESRGLRPLLQAVEACPQVQIIAVGQPSDSYAVNVFLQHPQVDYRGVVTPRECLELAAECDAVFAYYAPISQNQIYASPNKLFDAMCVGRPAILNSEVKMAQWAAEKSMALLCPYEDVGGLREILASLLDRRNQLKQYAQAARRCYLENHSWEKMESVLSELCASLEQGPCVAPRAAA